MSWLPLHSSSVLLKRFSPVALLLLFLLAQTVALLHAEVHAFHEHDQACEIFENVEKQPSLIGFEFSFEKTAQTFPEPLCILPSALRSVLTTAFEARAPPASLS